MRARGIVVLLILLLPVMLAGGIYLGGHAWLLPGGVRDALVSDSDDETALDQTYDLVENNYYRKVDRKKLIDGSINGVVKSLGDRFSEYYNAKDYKQFERDTKSEFSGIGVSIVDHPKGLKVVKVFDDSPAKGKGIVAGDVITAVNGSSIAGKSSTVSVPKLRGEVGTEVKVTVLRGKSSRTITLKRAEVKVPAVESALRTVNGQKIGVTHLSAFTTGSGKELRKATESLLKRGAEGLILDLRENGGGLVSESVDVASIYLPDGDVVVITKGRKRETETLKATGDPISNRIPMIVLVDGNSASASEIVTGALRDHHRAQIFGQKTFGKGVFQDITPLANGGGIKLTVGQYFTPSGENLGGQGVKRGAGIKPQVAARDRVKTKLDEGLKVALDALSEKLN